MRRYKHIRDSKFGEDDEFGQEELSKVDRRWRLSSNEDHVMTTTSSLQTAFQKPHVNMLHNFFVHNDLIRQLELSPAGKESGKLCNVESASSIAESPRPPAMARENKLCGSLRSLANCSYISVCQGANDVLHTVISLSSSTSGGSEITAGELNWQNSMKQFEDDVCLIECLKSLHDNVGSPLPISSKRDRASQFDNVAAEPMMADTTVHESEKICGHVYGTKDAYARSTQLHGSHGLKDGILNENHCTVQSGVHDKLYLSLHGSSTDDRRRPKRKFTDIAARSPTTSVLKLMPSQAAIHQQQAPLLRSWISEQTVDTRLQLQLGSCEADIQQAHNSVLMETLDCIQMQGSMKSSSGHVDDRASTRARPFARTAPHFEDDTPKAILQNGNDRFNTKSSNLTAMKQENGGSCTMDTVNKRESEESENELGMKLLDILLKSAKAVADNDKSTARSSLEKLYSKASLYGDSMQRLAMYFADAIAAHLAKKESLKPQDDLQEDSDITLHVFATLNKVTPFVQFAHFTINQAIVEAVQHHDRVHVLDMAFRNGCQWPSLIQSLVTREGGPPSSLRITAVGRNEASLWRSAAAVERFASSLSGTLKVSVEPVVVQDVEQEIEVLLRPRCRPFMQEFTVVNCCMQLHHLLSVPGALERFIANARSTGAKMLTLVEAEANHNAPSFVGRFVEALHFYAAVFDALDSSLPKRSPERLRLEQSYLACQIKDILASDGTYRTLCHEPSNLWRNRLATTGLQQLRFSSTTVNQAKLLLRIRAAQGYRLTELEGGFLCLAWQEKNVVSASAWSVQ